MGEVIHHGGDTILSNDNRNDDCVSMLEELLQKARDGEVVGISSAVQYADGSAGECVGGFIRHYPIAGALAFMMARMTANG